MERALAQSMATTPNFSGTMDLQATLSVASPVNQLPTFIRDRVSGMLPSELSRTAIVTGDLETGDFSYEIETSALTQVVDMFVSRQTRFGTT